MSQLQHFLLDSAEIRFRNLTVVTQVNIVVETVLNGRSDAEFHARVEFLQSLGQQVCRRVPEGVLSFGVVPFVEFDFSVVLNGARKVDSLVIDIDRQNLFCQSGADALGNLHTGNTAFKFASAAVGKCYFYHNNMSVKNGRQR